MKVLLTLVLREQDNNNSKTVYASLHKVEELLMPPAIHTYLQLKDGTMFYIDYLTQDLKNEVVILTYNHDIFYRDNRNGEMGQLENDYIKLGWVN